MRTEADYDKLADWAENDMDLTSDKGAIVHRGKDAARHGRSLLEQAAGGPAQLRHALGGRPSIDPTATPGTHSRTRQVRLPAEASDRLDALAATQHRRPSDVMRDALTDYLTVHS